MASDRRGDEAGREAQAKLDAAQAMLRRHPLLAPLMAHLKFHRSARCPEAAWAIACESGQVLLHGKRRAETDEWAWVLAHCALHYAFGHFQSRLAAGVMAEFEDVAGIDSVGVANLRILSPNFPPLPRIFQESLCDGP